MVRVSAGAFWGSGRGACAGVGAFGGVWLGVGQAVLRGAGVWACEGGAWELCGVSLLALCAGAGVGVVWNLVRWLRAGGDGGGFVLWGD